MSLFDKRDDNQPTIRQMELFHDTNLYIPTRTVYFGGTTLDEDIVNSITIAQVIKNLQILEHKDQGEPITLILNSCGGSWDDGIALYDMIRALKSPVNIVGMGKVYSMGSIILQGGDSRILTKHTTVMIHDGEEGYVGSPKSFESWASQSKLTRLQSYEIYKEQMIKKNPNITLEEIEEMCSHDTILSAIDAVDIGLADIVMEDVTKQLK